MQNRNDRKRSKLAVHNISLHTNEGVSLFAYVEKRLCNVSENVRLEPNRNKAQRTQARVTFGIYALLTCPRERESQEHETYPS